jgi:CysZ protein
MWPLAVMLVLIVAMYTFSTIANLLAAPFNGLLAEKAEALFTGTSPNSKETVWGACKQLPRIFMKELHKLGFQVKWLIVLLIVSVIPGLNIIAPLCWFCFSAWMTALEYCDYPMDNHAYSFPRVRETVGTQRWSCFSFGALVTLGNMVPLLNLLMMPAAVCGATLLWVERLKDE